MHHFNTIYIYANTQSVGIHTWREDWLRGWKSPKSQLASIIKEELSFLFFISFLGLSKVAVGTWQRVSITFPETLCPFNGQCTNNILKGKPKLYKFSLRNYISHHVAHMQVLWIPTLHPVGTLYHQLDPFRPHLRISYKFLHVSVFCY